MRTWLPLAVAVGLLVWLLVPWEPTDRAGTAPTDGRPEDASGPSLRGAAPHASPETPVPARGEETETTPPTEAGANRGEEGRLVVLELLGFDPSLADEVEVRLRPEDPRAGTSTVHRQWTHGPRIEFRIDPRWMRHVGEQPLLAAVHHPAYLPATVSLGVPVEAQGPLEGSLRLVPAYTVRARVTSPGSAGRPPQCDLALVLLDAEGRPTSAPPSHRPPGMRDVYQPFHAVDTTTARLHDGSYILRSVKPGRYAVIAQGPGYLPGCRLVSLGPERRMVEPEAIPMRRGRELPGVLRAGGEPVRGAALRIAAREQGALLRLPTGSVLWRDGRVGPGKAVAWTEDDGTFVCDGLPEGALVLRVTRTADPWTPSREPTRLLPTVYEGVEHPVGAEDEEITVDLPVAWVQVTVTMEEGATSYPHVFVTERPHDTVEDDTPAASVHEDHPHDEDFETGDEPIVVGVPPDREIVVSAAASGMQATLRKVPALAPGARRAVALHLVPDPGLATVVVEAEAAGGRAVEAFLVELTRLDVDRTETLGRPYAPGPSARMKVDPGRYRVRAAGPESAGAERTFLLSTTREVELRAGETTTVRLQLRRGGHLRLSAFAPDGRYVAAACRLLDAGGTVHTRRWQHAGPGAYMVDDEHLGAGSASTTTAPLPSGTWTVVLDAEGYEEARATVEIEPGRTATLEVAMRRR